MAKKIIRTDSKHKMVICRKCQRILDRNKENFGPLPGNVKKLDNICKLCRKDVNSKAQKEMHNHFHNERKKIIKRFL